MSLFRLWTPFWPECKWQFINVNDFFAKVNAILTAPLFPIMFFHPVARVSVYTFVNKGNSRTCMKMTRWVAWRETELTMANCSPRHSYTIWFIFSLEGVKIEPVIDARDS